MTAVLRRSGLARRAVRAQRSSGVLTGLGILLTTVLVGGVVLIGAVFGGVFTKYVPVEAVISGSGNAVAKGNQVIYRDVPVGTVATNGSVGRNGDIVVSLHIIPSRARSIPANVTATVDPVTIFGTEYVVLETPAAPSAARLSSGTVIQPTRSASGANVQGAISSLDSILNALHPAQLDVALTAIATALQGQGKGIGHTLSSIDGYLGQMLPHFPELAADLSLLAPVANQVAASAPQLVGSLSNLAATARVITSHAGELRRATAGGATLANQLYALLAPTQQPLEEILAAAGPFFADVDQSPTELAQIVTGLRAWATSWSSAEQSGPYLSFSTSVPLANATDLVFAALNAPGTAGPGGLAAGALGDQHVDPPTYTSRAFPATASSVSVRPALITAAEVTAAGRVETSLDGGRAPSSPAVASLYLAPVLNNLVLSS